MPLHLETFANSLSEMFPTADIDAGRPEFGSIHLRFELGDEYPNGSEERISQATDRAVSLFVDCNAENDSLIVIANDFSNDETNNRYLKSLLDGMTTDGQIRSVDYTEEDENCVEQTFSFRQLLLRTCRSKVNYHAILRGVTHREQGREPVILEDVYFYNETRNLVFYMYDDRGCLIWSNRPETLELLYSKYNNWLVDYHREHFDSIWGRSDQS